MRRLELSQFKKWEKLELYFSVFAVPLFEHKLQLQILVLVQTLLLFLGKLTKTFITRASLYGSNMRQSVYLQLVLCPRSLWRSYSMPPYPLAKAKGYFTLPRVLTGEYSQRLLACEYSRQVPFALTRVNSRREIVYASFFVAACITVSCL